VERASTVGDTIRSRMLAWQERWPEIGDVRGLGAMLAIELVKDPATKEPAADVASAVIEEAFRNGLLLIKSGTDGNCIRVLTPLVVTDSELDEALGVWEDALASVLRA
jgi:4-aminobutyrate aminotransferase/(S)-3-amino-2-methylpropionate transaminase